MLEICEYIRSRMDNYKSAKLSVPTEALRVCDLIRSCTILFLCCHTRGYIVQIAIHGKRTINKVPYLCKGHQKCCR